MLWQLLETTLQLDKYFFNSIKDFAKIKQLKITNLRAMSLNSKILLFIFWRHSSTGVNCTVQCNGQISEPSFPLVGTKISPSYSVLFHMFADFTTFFSTLFRLIRKRLQEKKSKVYFFNLITKKKNTH